MLNQTAPLALPVCLLTSACVSATAIDTRLTEDGRAAVGRRGQPPVQHVDDMTECREKIMDRLFYAGAYVIFPFPTGGPSDALRGWRATFAACMRERGYEMPALSATESRATP
jgi:hypothetical protein